MTDVRSNAAGRRIALALAVLGAEALACFLIAPEGVRLRWFVDVLTVQGILIALAGSFLVVDAPFAAARAVRRAEAGREPAGGGAAVKASRFRVGLALLFLGGALFGAASLLWAVAR